MIPFNKPYLSGKELEYISKAVMNGKLSGNGMFTQLCHSFFEKEFGFKKVLLTTSCTDALEMSALLAEIKDGDEVILPSFTFVSTANAFLLRNAKLVFCDSSENSPNIDPIKIKELITNKTKAIVVVHYAGVACDMEPIIEICNQHNIYLIEDAAQAIDSYYKGTALGSIGDFGAFSFHETKNIISGEGGLLTINNEKYHSRSEILWEKGTNRSAFFKGEADKYGWVDIGSSYLPSEIISAFLYAQLENMDFIQNRRLQIWNLYKEELKELESKGFLKLPEIPSFATNNAHLFYLVLENEILRDSLIKYLKGNDVLSVFHYLPLHSSAFFFKKHDGRHLKWADYYSERLIRLPLFVELTDLEVFKITKLIKNFFNR